MVREGLRLGLAVAALAWAAGGLPLVPFLFVAGVVPGLWWSSGAWEADDVALWASLQVSVVAAVVAWLLAGVGAVAGVQVPWELGLAPALLVGTQLARIRLRRSPVEPTSPEAWARLHAHRYGPGRPDRALPDLTSSDPLALLVGSRRRRPLHLDPYARVPYEHELQMDAPDDNGANG